jgi:hypothetical protein
MTAKARAIPGQLENDFRTPPTDEDGTPGKAYLGAGQVSRQIILQLACGVPDEPQS